MPRICPGSERSAGSPGEAQTRKAVLGGFGEEGTTAARAGDAINGTDESLREHYISTHRLQSHHLYTLLYTHRMARARAQIGNPTRRIATLGP